MQRQLRVRGVQGNRRLGFFSKLEIHWILYSGGAGQLTLLKTGRAQALRRSLRGL